MELDETREKAACLNIYLYIYFIKKKNEQFHTLKKKLLFSLVALILTQRLSKFK